MTNEEIEIARAFVECGRWKWLPGMRRLTFDGGHLYPSRVADDGTYPGGLFPAPDITDPITAWGTLELVKRAGAYIHKLSVLPMGCNLIVEWPDSVIDSFRGTFAGVLLQALQAAPPVRVVTDGGRR